jgi:integrase
VSTEAGEDHWAETQRIFEKDVLPRWGDRSVRSITRKDVVWLIDAIDDRSPAVSRSVFAQLRKLFNWCVERDLISVSPLLGLRAPAPQPARDRWLSDREISLFWLGCEALGEPFGPLFQTLLLTAQRRDEVTGMRWSELDLGKAEWIIPASRAKNRKEHVVDLSPAAIALIESRSREHEFVFTTTGSTATSGHGHAKALLDLHIETLRLARRAKTPALAPWRIHDLRRTAATGMAALGHAPHVIEAVLNHASGSRGGLVAVYQHYQYRAERKAALQDWGAHVSAIVELSEQTET